MGTASDELAKRAKNGQGGGRSTGWPAEQFQPMVRLSGNIQKYGLEENIAELESQGLTVVPPEKAATPEFIERLRAATIRFIEQRDGRAPDFVTGETHRNQILGDYHYLILHD